MKKIFGLFLISIVMAFFFIIGCPTSPPTTNPPTIDDPGTVWMNPANAGPMQGEPFVVKFSVNTGMEKMGTFGATVTYDPDYLSLIKNEANNNFGVKAGSDNVLIMAVNSNTPGTLVITGTSADFEGAGPSIELGLFIIDFTAVQMGSSDIGITVQTLTTSDGEYETIGVPAGIGGKVTIL